MSKFLYLCTRNTNLYFLYPYMKKFILDLTVTENIKLHANYVLLKLTSQSLLPEMLPGQFAELRVDGSPTTFLRRPISINFVDKQRNEVWFLIQLLGDGTRRLAEVNPGDVINVVLPLGNGYTMPQNPSDKLLLVGGGVGTAPVYPQVKWLHEHGIDADVIVGAKNKDLLILEKEMEAVAGNLYITTDDGSYVRKGMGTDVLKDLVNNQGKKYDRCIAIGPLIMMKFVCLLTKELGIPTIVSMNPIMVDGTGMCGACRLQVGDEIKFACVDGPEFDGHLVDFDQAMKRQQMYKTEEGRAMLKLQEGATHHGGCGNCNS